MGTLRGTRPLAAAAPGLGRRPWAAAKGRLPAYRLAGDLLAADLHHKTGQVSTWTVTVTTWEEGPPEPRRAPVVARPALPAMGVVPSLEDGSGHGRDVPALDPPTLTSAVTELLVACGDHVIEELWSRWPLCASHVAELGIDENEGSPTWSCPVDGQVWDAVGKLQPHHIQRD